MSSQRVETVENVEIVFMMFAVKRALDASNVRYELSLCFQSSFFILLVVYLRRLRL